MLNKTELMTKATRTFHKVGFGLKKHSPEILVVAGVVGTVTSAVMACKATTKISEILDESKSTIDTIHKTVEKVEAGEKIDYTVDDSKKDLAIVYTQTAVKLAKLYAPSVALGALSITGIVASHVILKKRNIAIAAAYATIDKSFKDYRGRVVERFGEKLDKELRYGIKAVEFDEVEVDEKGKEKVTKKTVEVIDPNAVSDYARFFDVGNDNWTKDPEYNLMFLRKQCEYANHRLKAEGYLFLNDVYEMLGIPRSKAGQQVGWVYDNPNGDGYVDFGIYDSNKQTNVDFVNGYERTILLDFNVDGVILDLM